MLAQTLFGTSGIRRTSQEFTPQFCFDLGRAFAYFLDEHQQIGKVGIGIDTRTSSPHIAQNVIYGLRHAKREVVHLGSLPVPAAHYSILSMSLSGSIMVTGSHIDLNSNGLKFFALKEEISKSHELEISNIYYQVKEQLSPVAIYGSVENNQQALNNYIELLLSQADHPLPKLRIVFDPGNGGQTEAIMTLLTELHQDVIAINNHIQEPLLSRDTEEDGAFILLQDAVRLHHADLGIGFDSDGDRVVFIDRFGNFVPGDYTGTILARWHASGVVACPINVSNVVNFIGKQVIRTRVGSPFVIAAMKKYGASFGFESNGGGIHEDIMLSRDGGSSLIKMLNILKWTKKELHQLVAQLPKTHIRRGKFSCPIDRYPDIMSRSRNFLNHQSIDETDGIKLILDKNTWVLFRPSGNAPEFRVFVESNSQTKATQLLDHALAFAKQVAQIN